MKHTTLATFALAAVLTPAFAAGLRPGDSNPGFTTGQVPSAAQWNSIFSSKFDYAGGLLGGPLGLMASSALGASFNLGCGAAPVSPNNGDIWCTSSGLYVQIAGATIGPLGTGGGGGGGGGSGLTVGTTTIASGTTGYIEYDAAGVLGELATTGSGNVVLATSPVLVTPNLGTPSVLNLANATGLPIAGLSGLGSGVATALGAAVNASGGIVSPTPAAPGDLAYWNGSAWTKFAGNTSGTQFLVENASGTPAWNSGPSSGVSSLSYSCPAGGPFTGAVTLPLGIQPIAESTAGWTPAASQCGAWFDATAGGYLPVIGTAGGDVTNPWFATLKNARTDGTPLTWSTTDGKTINYNGSTATSITLYAGQSVGITPNAAANAWTATGTEVGSTPIWNAGDVSGKWYDRNLQQFIATGASQTASSVYCTLQQINVSETFQSMGAYFTTGVSSGNVSFALFNASAGVPSTLIDYAGPVAAPTTANTSVSASLHNGTDTLTPGLYFACDTQDNATAVMNSVYDAASSAGYSWIGTSSPAPPSGPAAGISCTAASTCGAGYAAWSAGAFTWASFTSPTWSTTETTKIPLIEVQAH